MAAFHDDLLAAQAMSVRIYWLSLLAVGVGAAVAGAGRDDQLGAAPGALLYDENIRRRSSSMRR